MLIIVLRDSRDGPKNRAVSVGSQPTIIRRAKKGEEEREENSGNQMET